MTDCHPGEKEICFVYSIFVFHHCRSYGDGGHKGIIFSPDTRLCTHAPSPHPATGRTMNQRAACLPTLWVSAQRQGPPPQLQGLPRPPLCAHPRVTGLRSFTELITRRDRGLSAVIKRANFISPRLLVACSVKLQHTAQRR